MALRKYKKASEIYNEVNGICDVVINVLEETEELLKGEETIAVIRNPKGRYRKLISQLLEIQHKAHKISAFGNKISEVARTTRSRLEG